MMDTLSSARSSQRSESSQPLSFAESDLDTVREFDELGRDPNHSSGFATRSALFEHRRKSDQQNAQRRIDYHIWGGDYTFASDPKEQRATSKNLRRTIGGDRGWWIKGRSSTNGDGRGVPGRKSTEPKPVVAIPLEVWTGIEMAPTWKPSTNDPTGRTGIELKGVHPTNKPVGDTRLAQRRQRNVRGMGTHLSIACGPNTHRRGANIDHFACRFGTVMVPWRDFGCSFLRLVGLICSADSFLNSQSAMRSTTRSRASRWRPRRSSTMLRSKHSVRLTVRTGEYSSRYWRTQMPTCQHRVDCRLEWGLIPFGVDPSQHVNVCVGARRTGLQD
jgi:hypothetical protein